jgi:hypothetical protein
MFLTKMVRGVSAISAVAVSSVILFSQYEKNSQQRKKPRSDIQAHTHLISKIKASDLPILIRMLDQSINLSLFNAPDKRLVVTDLGASDGKYVLDVLIETGAFFLMNACEPKTDRVAGYYEKIVSSNGRLAAGKIEATIMGEYVLPQSDLILANHSMYYQPELWQCLLGRFFQSLKDGGVLQVVMQSEDSSLSDGKLDNLSFEKDILYPVLNERAKADGTPDYQVVSAEDFESALNEYANRSGVELNIETQVSITDIDIDPIFDPNELGEGQDLLSAYTRCNINQSFFSAHRESFLRQLKERACKDNTDCTIRHINKVMTITRTKPAL